MNIKQENKVSYLAKMKTVLIANTKILDYQQTEESPFILKIVYLIFLLGKWTLFTTGKVYHQAPCKCSVCKKCPLNAMNYCQVNFHWIVLGTISLVKL